jgi:NAD(P)-dependent dehydrogenase (short-subunit alcohol dehydrogenase family)
MNASRLDPRHYAPAPDLFRDRILLVTGAGSGIGRAVALALARHGATVALLGRTAAHLEATYDAIVAAGGAKPALLPFNLETAHAQDFDALAAALRQEFGRLDGLLHNASILGTRAPIVHYDVPTWCRVLHVNLTATFILTQLLLPLLERSADATMLFTTSSVGRRGRAYWGAYAVSKFGTEGLMQVLADELETEGRIRVNCVNPGPTRTGMRALAYPAEDATRLKRPEEIVPTYLYLLGPDSRGISGERFDCQP